jgi:hypothetical protein
VIVVPVLIIAGLALHLYVRRRLSRARQQPRPFDREERASGRGDVIEVEYRVVDRP